MKSKLPEGERENVDKALWDKSGGLCWLCEEPMNRASDNIQADHDVPESEGGSTDLQNLHLAHDSCNKAKRNAKTVPIRPYLKLVAYARKSGGRLKYDGFLKHFGIVPKPVVLESFGSSVKFEFPDGSSTEVPVFQEENRTGCYKYVFVQVPRAALFNDDACQPRAVRTDHAWSIYSDMQRNVLHEPPSARLADEVYGKSTELLLFDGQHKTIASWMMGRDFVTTKVYLNLTTAQANELVNSIQAKIKKLPLSPFELAGKMADEWENKFSEYESQVGAGEVSEQGFISWLPQTDRARAKSALHSALLQNVLSSPDLRIANHVKRAGDPARPFSFTEQQLKAKVLEKLLAKDPLAEKGDAAQTTRDAEAENIIKLLNLLNDCAFEPPEESAGMAALEVERARRMSYQSSLAYISGLIRQIWNRETYGESVKRPMSDELTAKQAESIETSIRNLVQHPVWTAEFDRDEKMSAVKVALEKNQEGASAFGAVGLDIAYMVLGKSAPTYVSYWGS